MGRIYLCVFLLGLLLPSINARRDKFFRKDYTYIEELNAFYKVHWDSSGDTWDSAFLACNDEEANLFYPKQKEEWGPVKVLMQNMTEQPNVTDIFVGYHNKYHLGEFITVDGHATPYPLIKDVIDNSMDQCILMSINTGEFRISPCARDPESPLPFFCKKEIQEDMSCPTVDKGYKYSTELRRCYKVNKTPKLWSEAVQTCYMEGGMLVLAETSEELQKLSRFVESGTYSSGFRKLYPREEYYTLAGQKFKGEINKYQPVERYNNYGEPEMVYGTCGAIEISRGARSSTESCDTYRPFICQMEISKD
ncbi:unnamed protein product [Chrysodeixis includens]|uniref:C-type lectin domain-containing protein n=1 Tax=Chrysodeixis includens TaxID=689277 RepID=A0A9P0C3J1_CHRIL|nr:unnamed protein product [Chrysodeixis includens]